MLSVQVTSSLTIVSPFPNLETACPLLGALLGMHTFLKLAVLITEMPILTGSAYSRHQSLISPPQVLPKVRTLL